jgi:hypothetical protein
LPAASPSIWRLAAIIAEFDADDAANLGEMTAGILGWKKQSD